MPLRGAQPVNGKALAIVSLIIGVIQIIYVGLVGAPARLACQLPRTRLRIDHAQAS